MAVVARWNDATGMTIYGLAFNSTGQVWSTVAAGWVTLASADWANYDIVASENPAASGRYEWSNPAGITEAQYEVELFSRDGAAPAITDTFLARRFIGAIGAAVDASATGVALGVGGRLDLKIPGSIKTEQTNIVIS